MIDLSLRKQLQGASGAMELQVKLQVEQGCFLAVEGPSGSGKTTLLRILAGLEEAEGEITVDGESWLKGRRSLPPQQRSIGFVFQEYALFPHMTVAENLLYAAPDNALADRLMALTGLTELAGRRTERLSGGQKQRVALCRALMRRPKLLLMDEPLSALDPTMRAKLQEDILRLHREFGTTTLMVSHDPAEIYRLADRVLRIEEGRIVREGEPSEVLLRMSGSRKCSLNGELLAVERRDVIHVAVVALGQQIVELVLDAQEAEALRPGERVEVSVKAFAPVVTPLKG